MGLAVWMGLAGAPQPVKDRDNTANRLEPAGRFLWIGLFCLIAWTRFDNTWFLVGAALLVSWAALGRQRGWRHGISVVLLSAGVVAGFRGDVIDRRFSEGWDQYWEERREAVAEQLGAEFDALVAEGDAAVERLARAWTVDDGRAVSARSARGVGPVLQDSLPVVLDDTGLAAAAVIGTDGRLVVWEGSHQGRLPKEDLAATGDYAYAGTPLFSYLYFTRALPDEGGLVVVAALISSDLPDFFASGLGDFASRFRERTGERISVSRSDRASGPGVFDFGWPDEALLSITIKEPAQNARRAEERGRWARIVAILAAMAWLALSFGVSRANLAYSVAVLGAGAALLPLDGLFQRPELVDPAVFGLAGPVPLTLGRVVLLCAAIMPAAVLTLSRRRPQTQRWAAPLVVALSFPLVLVWMGRSASPELLGTTDARWIVFQTTVAVILGVVVATALTWRPPAGVRSSPGLVALGLAIAGALGFLIAIGVRTGPAVTPLLAVLWAGPALAVARGLGPVRPVSYLHWFCSFCLAATAVLPFTWSMRTEARMAIAEEQMGRLGVASEQDLEVLLDRFAEQVDSLDQAGAGEVEMMYQAWVGSELAGRGTSMFLTLWSADDVPLQELRLGVKGDRPAIVNDLLPELRLAGTREYHDPENIDVHHLVAVPLADGRLVTGTVPPRRTIEAPSSLGPLFASVEEEGDQEFLTLVRTSANADAVRAGTVDWSRNQEGWRADGVARYPDGPYLVFYTISIPNLSVMLARATLLMALGLVLFSAVWLISVTILGFRLPTHFDWRGLLTSFRARVTLTLFGFFILSNVLFGTLAYRTLAGASERTATALAERVVSQIAEAYREEGGSMELLARRVGADLLEYREGELVGGSVDELIQLGLYEGWVDPRIYHELETRQRLRASQVETLGDWRYVVAHRRLPDGDIVASPIPLRAGAAALRQRDVADLLGFAIVLGPILSLGLALFVGRALTRPIQTLQVASERVGSGNLAVHLPEDRVDEFGSVFAAFNRMVLRLDDARRELLRTTRRTEAIVEEAATGVIAVDPAGRVTVANPRAESLLATSLAIGEAVPAKGEYAAALAEWLDGYARSGSLEADEDFRWGGRRIQVRARRIVQEGHKGGVVVNLEDVTDELRSERILAWGEMAKQVAHEVKNPLTPIKLSVQHLRRAWEDRRGDFGRILDRNVGAILGEIDRLASISRSFSRLASPGAAEAGPLVAVDPGEVIRELLNLYQGGGETTIRLESALPATLPPVLARPDEMKEVLLNLLENARAAMPGGGVVRIGATEPESSGGPGRVVVEVEDEGAGIPRELLPRIFEPQFSTRSTGAGLGLAIAKRLVDSWGGTVDVRSEVGSGTIVRIGLRVAAPLPDKAPEDLGGAVVGE